ncbi:hypothetical protein [Bradyrhizobium liaoningense]|uniref:hypothetical protein n=1 Tax=Bradyrhizobium liaoningense TaxID=43992 RepID=UPI001BAC7EB3|nr:hypothetical protein [Bradyrhizobium liaoningense]MBR0823508.1 hypothetical protein [Bradyrhizobium liaoningense]
MTSPSANARGLLGHAHGSGILSGPPEAICHGDFGSKNIMLQGAEPRVIVAVLLKSCLAVCSREHLKRCRAHTRITRIFELPR